MIDVVLPGVGMDQIGESIDFYTQTAQSEREEASILINSSDFRLGYILPEDIDQRLETAQSFEEAAQALNRQARWLGLPLNQENC